MLSDKEIKKILKIKRQGLSNVKKMYQKSEKKCHLKMMYYIMGEIDGLRGVLEQIELVD